MSFVFLSYWRISANLTSEAYDARKWYGVLMRYFEDVFIRCFENMAKDALKKMYLQVASMLAQDKCLRRVFSSCLQLILE